MPSIGAGGRIGRVLKPYLIVVGQINFLVVARMDIALGNLKVYQILLGILSVMDRIDTSCNFIDYCLHLPSLTMLKMLLT